ncbi:cytochrome c oxidase subunit 3 [Phyllobacterium phragmitis]|uniref:Cytochrome c oxidase subunit 3 n=1 Tax=Phyllobacterium phragmitis TaxID=2670329 RepID=A0ABQ0H2E1_9HYPH
MTTVPSSASERADAGDDLLFWILVWSELTAFAILFLGYLVMSVLNADSFDIARLHLSPGLASLNTLVLLASGWQAALAARENAGQRQQRIALLAAAGLGLVFVALKFVEYSSEWRFAGEESFHAFFELYFMITGFHLAHVAFVAVLLVIVALKPARSNVVMLATVWHIIDLVWLVMFPLIYLG